MSLSAARHLALLALLTLASLITSPAAAQLKPLDVEHDANGVDLLSGKIETRMPALAAPGAPNLRFAKLQDLQPFLSGTLIVSPDNKATYDINNGSLASEHFDCTDNECKSKKSNGSVLIPDPAGKTFDYYAGGSATLIHFDLQNFDQSILVGNIGFSFYPSYIEYANGEQVTFTYDTYTNPANGYVYRRPASIASSLGYSLTLTYQAAYPNLGWTDVAQAILRGPGNVVVGQNTYSGSTITDLAGRVFTCTFCGNSLGSSSTTTATTLRLPGESVDTLQATGTQCGATGYSYLSQVTTDAVPYNYSFHTTSTNCMYIDKATITGPLSFSRTVNIYNGANIRPRITSIVDSLGRTTSYLYDNDVRVTKATYPEGNSAGVTYDGIGNITESRLTAKVGSGLADIVETAFFTSSGCIPGTGCICPNAQCFKPQWTRDAKGQQTDFTWTPEGELLTKLEPVNASGQRRKTINAYDAPTGVQRLIRERVCATDSAGVELTCGTASEIVREFTYWGLTLLPLTETVKDGIGGQARTTSFTYDAAGRLLSSDGPLTGTDDATYNRYDTIGRRTWEIGPKGANGTRLATRTTWRTADDQPLTVEKGYVVNPDDTLLNVLSADYLTYDTRRKVTKKRTAASGTDYAVSQFSYDARNRDLCSTVRMNPAAWASLPADACALGTAGTAGPDRVTRTSYDAESRVTLIEKAVGTPIAQNYVAYTYTPNGKREFVTDANGNKAQFKYDGFDRQSFWYFPSKTTPGTVSTTDYEQYGYDPNGNRTSLRKRDGRTLTFAYDARNQMGSKLVPDGCAPIQLGPCPAASATRDVFYTYDIQGRQLTAKFDSTSGADGITNAYDLFGNPTSSSISMAGFTKALTGIYDIDNRRTQLTHPDSKAFTYAYDAADRLSGVYEGAGTATVLDTFTYTNQGLLGSRGERLGSGVSYGYDGIGRLATMADTFVGGTGNVSRAFAYAPSSQLSSQTRDNDAYAWTGSVNTDRPYAVNGLNQYTTAGAASLTYDSNGSLLTDGTNSYGYDAENRLITATAAGVTATLTYDPLGRLWQVVKGTANTRFLTDGDALVIEYNSAGTVTNRYVHGSNAAADDPLVWYTGAGVTTEKWLHADQLGSIVAATNTSGGSPTINSYDEYGVPGAANSGRFQYTGQAWLSELGGAACPGGGLYYYKARLYSPCLGRFLQVDAVGYDDQINLYIYVGNDPINDSDPTGNCGLIISGCGIGDDSFGEVIGTQSDATNLPHATANESNAGNSGGSDPGGKDTTKKIREGLKEVRDKLADAGDQLRNAADDMKGAALQDIPDAAATVTDALGITSHAALRREQARAGDSSRDVGDPNRVRREGRAFTDTTTGNRVYVSGNKMVVTDPTGARYLSQRKITRRDLQSRIRRGRLVPE